MMKKMTGRQERGTYAAALLLTLLPIAGCSRTRAAARAEPARGHLFFAGGGPLPAAFFRRFVELAGGAGRARIAIFPTASSDPETGVDLAEDLRKLGARAEHIATTREEAQRPDAGTRLEGITGIWFSGGDQSRLTAALGGTPLEAAIHARHRAGAVVGGTSAGAAVISRIMITGDERRPGGSRPPADSSTAFLTIERNNIVTVQGFGFLSNVIVDQHFVRRRRHNRLVSLVLEHPELVGVGIDEATAVEVGPGGWWRVLGESVVVIYDARRAKVAPPGEPLGGSDLRMHVLPAGSRFRPDTGEVQLPTAARAGP